LKLTDLKQKKFEENKKLIVEEINNEQEKSQSLNKTRKVKLD